MQSNPLLTTLDKLRRDPRLAALGQLVPPLRLFGALGVARDEVAHSRLLATLLDPRTHAGAETLLRTLLARVAERTDTPSVAVATIRRLPAAWGRVVVRRELYRVDVIADISGPHGLVIGIENKIDAGEGGEQLSRYQDFLRDRFPGRSALMLFLTPSGRMALTAAPGHPVPCVAISYADVLAAIAAVRATATERDAGALDLVSRHLREEIMGEDDEIRKAVRELWRDHPDALRRIVEHRPQLSDICDAYENEIRRSLGKSNIEFLLYPPSRGDLRQIKFWLNDWWPTCPFVFVLCEREGQLFTRVLIWREDYDKSSPKLSKWAAKVNAEYPNTIDEDFKPIPHMSAWRRVFVEEDWPADALLPVSDTDEGTAKAAAKQMLERVERLRPHVPGPK